MSKMPEYVAYMVTDHKDNRKNYPDLVGKVFNAPPGYVNVLPYRKIKTRGFTVEDSVAILGVKE